jgi:hypothetical protein
MVIYYHIILILGRGSNGIRASLFSIFPNVLLFVNIIIIIERYIDLIDFDMGSESLLPFGAVNGLF